MNALVGQGQRLLGASGWGSAIFRINPGTGTATALLGDIGYTSSGDLAFHNGNLYASVVNGGFNYFVQIGLNGDSFTATNLGHVGNANNLFSLVQGSDGVLYGITGTTVWRIDTVNPAFSSVVVADYAANGSGLGPAGGAASGVSVSQETLEVPNSGVSTAALSVTAIAGCSWTAVSNVGWITITGGGAGTGDGAVTYQVAPNSGGPRTGTLAIGGHVVTVAQGNTFSNTASITIPMSGSASPYPSTVTVSGVNDSSVPCRSG